MKRLLSMPLFRNRSANRSVSNELIHTSRSLFNATMQKDFEHSKEKLNTLKEDPGNEVKLKLYSLFKQATIGKCNSKRPGMIDFVGRAKWDAWNALGDMSGEDAMKQYIETVSQLVGAETQSDSGQKPEGAEEKNGLITQKDGRIYRIKFNRPNKLNAITREMYQGIFESLEEAGKDPSTTVTVLESCGDYFSSGNDLGNFKFKDISELPQLAESGKVLLKKYVSAFIDHPKPLIALVHGPAVGISVTVLGLFDIVFASDKATFHTPFTSLGQSPEGCSSYTFPQIMGSAKANEFLLFGKKLSAQEAFDCRLVTQVFRNDSFSSETEARLKEFSELPPKSLAYSKKLIRDVERARLHEVNAKECELLGERWLSDECMNAIAKFFTGKSKL